MGQEVTIPTSSEYMSSALNVLPEFIQAQWPVEPTDPNGILYFDDYLVPSGLPELASKQARATTYVGSIEARGGPFWSERSRLTYSLMHSVGALFAFEVQQTEEGRVSREISKRSTQLARTILAITLENPGNIYLPSTVGRTNETAGYITATQALGVEGLARQMNGWRNHHIRRVCDEVLKANANPDSVDVLKWQETLRRDYLRMFTQEENDSYQNYLRGEG